jgi:uncharacterized membrane protein
MDNPNPTPPAINPPPAAGEAKTVAIIAYITLIGFIAAAIIHSGKKTKLGAYHLRQRLGFILTEIVVGPCALILMCIPFVGCLVWPCVMLFSLAMFVFWILGLVAAINGEMKPMPVVGPLYQKWLGTTFD